MKGTGPTPGVRLMEVSVLKRCPSYGGVRLTEVSVKRELTVLHRAVIKGRNP